MPAGEISGARQVREPSPPEEEVVVGAPSSGEVRVLLLVLPLKFLLLA
jgi:hypothetical protein